MNKQTEGNGKTESLEAKRPFVEPEISDPVEVMKGNPAAGALFAVVVSGGGGDTP